MTLMGERMARRIRSAVFEALLFQEIAWFDVVELRQRGLLSLILTVDVENMKVRTIFVHLIRKLTISQRYLLGHRVPSWWLS
jgi:hypothetical protein